MALAGMAGGGRSSPREFGSWGGGSFGEFSGGGGFGGGFGGGGGGFGGGGASGGWGDENVFRRRPQKKPRGSAGGRTAHAGGDRSPDRSLLRPGQRNAITP